MSDLAYRCLSKTEAEWQYQNPILAPGEMGFSTDTRQLKIGDGFTPWKNLSCINGENTEKVSAAADDLLPDVEAAPARLANIHIAGNEEPEIIINADRTITIPAELKNIAVQYDNNIETVTFRCPRYWDTIDLASNSVIKIITTHSNEFVLMGSSRAHNITIINTNEFTFDWLVPQILTQESGTISLSITIVDDSDTPGWRWNSQINQNGFTILPTYANDGIDYDEWGTIEDCRTILEEMVDDIVLNDYVKNTDYATEQTAGLIKGTNTFALSINSGGGLMCNTLTNEDFQNKTSDAAFVSVGTLKNVLAALINNIKEGGEDINE